MTIEITVNVDLTDQGLTESEAIECLEIAKSELTTSQILYHLSESEVIEVVKYNNGPLDLFSKEELEEALKE